MAGAIAQPRNAVVDMVDVLTKVYPLMFGSGSSTTTSSSYVPQFDPAVAAQSDSLLQQLLQRSSSTTQADKVIEDILYRAQLAFAPVLGEEKSAGLYNTSVRQQLAKEAMARATAASAAAVLQDQQQAMQQATAVQNARVNAASNAQQAGATKTQTTKGAPAMSIKGLAGGIGGSILASMGIKKGKKVLEDLFKGEEFDKALTGSFESAELGSDSFMSEINEGASSSFSSGGAGSAFGDSFDSSLSGSFDSAEGGFESFSSISSADNTFGIDDNAALQSILDSVTVPTMTQDMTQLAGPESVLTQGADALAGGIQIGAADVVTPAGMMPPAVPVNPITGEIVARMPPASPMMPPAVVPTAADGSVEEAGNAAADVFEGFGTGGEELFPDTVTAVAGDVALSSGVEAAFDPALAGSFEAAELGSAALETAEGAAGIGDMIGGFDIGIPYFTIANAVTGGQLGQAVAETPIVGDVLQGVGEVIDEIPIVGDLVSGFGDVTASAGEVVSDVVGGVGGAVGEVWDGVSGVFEDVGSAAGSIVCTESNKQKLLSDRLYLQTAIASRKLFGKEVYSGYHKIAAPLVRRMKKDPAFAATMARLATAYGEYVVNGKFSFAGAAVRWIGAPVAYLVGRLAAQRNTHSFPARTA